MVGLFAVYVEDVYCQYSWRVLLLPIVSLFVFWSIIDLRIDLGRSNKWFRSMSMLLFLCHYIFVRLFVCVPVLTGYFTAGIYKYLFVTTLVFVLSAILVFTGNKNSKVR